MFRSIWNEKEMAESIKDFKIANAQHDLGDDTFAAIELAEEVRCGKIRACQAELTLILIDREAFRHCTRSAPRRAQASFRPLSRPDVGVICNRIFLLTRIDRLRFV